MTGIDTKSADVEITKESITERLDALETRVSEVDNISTQRAGVADEMQGILCNTISIQEEPLGEWSTAILNWAIKSVGERVPDIENLQWEAERFITLVRNILK